MAHSTRRSTTSTAVVRTGRRSVLAPRLKAPKGPPVPNLVTVKNLHDSGPGSLRAAVQYANSHPNTTIQFAYYLHGTIKLTGGELAITADTTVEGPGAPKLAVSGTNHTRVFAIGTGATATISGLTITNGLADSSAPDIKGFGGGILNRGDLTLKDTVVSYNQAVGAASDTSTICGYSLTGAAGGGGVANLGTLIVSDTKFVDNQARGASLSTDPGKSNTFPGVASGGALANIGMATATVTNSRFTGNLAQAGNDCVSLTGIAGDAGGGAIASFGFTPPSPPGSTPPPPNVAALTVSGSHFSKNQAIGGNGCQSPLLPGHSFGGAVASHRFTGSAEMNVCGCTFDHNQAIGGNQNVVTGAGKDLRAIPNMAAAGGLFACGKATIIDNTFEHNEAIGGRGVAGSSGIPITKDGGDARGGGIGFAFQKTVVTIINCTVKHNSATGGQAGDGGTGGKAWGGGVGITAAGPTVTVIDSTIDNNEAQGGSGRLHPQPGDGTHFHRSNGGDGQGGGVYTIAGAKTTLIAGSITQNWARGGKGGQGGQDGQGIGGGLYRDDIKGVTFNPATVRRNHATTSNDNVYP